MPERNAPRLARSAALRSLAVLGTWLCLAKGELDSLAFGLIVVVGTTVLSLRVLPPSRGAIDCRRVPGFLWHFIWASLVGGVDVAKRAMSLRPALMPDLIVCRLTLASVGERVMLADLISLLPGTLSADLQGFDLTVHALDRSQDIQGHVRTLESQIRALRHRGGQ